jgi:IS5 family transposase
VIEQHDSASHETSRTGPESVDKADVQLEFLDEMNQVVPWSALTALIEPHCRKGKTGRPPMGIETMLRLHVLQQRTSSQRPAPGVVGLLALAGAAAKNAGVRLRWHAAGASRNTTAG